jgi:glucosamine-6-phosphate deaminase
VPQPQITVLDDYEMLSRTGAELVADVLAERPNTRVVVATGATPMGLYRELARKREDGDLDASNVTVFQLDEYIGVAPDDRRSLLGWAMRSFVEPLDIPASNVVPLPVDGDPAACAVYDRDVAEAGGYDLAILGIGMNGHIGFNEPPSDATVPTRMVQLSRESVGSNAVYWGDEARVPRLAVTIGMAGLLRSRTILLVAAGGAKRDIVRRALLGPVAPEVPASLLQNARDLRVLLDRAAWDGAEDSP